VLVIPTRNPFRQGGEESGPYPAVCVSRHMVEVHMSSAEGEKMELQPSAIFQVVEDLTEHPLECGLLMFQMSWEETADLRVSSEETLVEMPHKIRVMPKGGVEAAT
jgi:hypothetical protein